MFNLGSGYIYSCPSVSRSRRTEATLTLSATFGSQIITLITAEVLCLFSLERHFSLTVNFLCHSSHNSSACSVNKDRKRAWGGGGALTPKTIGPLMFDLSPAVASLLFLTLKLAPQAACSDWFVQVRRQCFHFPMWGGSRAPPFLHWRSFFFFF